MSEPTRTGPRSIALTRRGWTLAGAAAGLVVGSRVLGAGPLAALGIAGAALLAFAFAWVTARRPALTLGRRLRPARVHVGGEGLVVLDGVAGTPLPLLTLTDRVDRGRRAARFVVSPQPAGAPLRAAYRIPTTRRGRHVVGPLVATLSDPLGLARRSWTVAEATDVVVCPRVHDVLAPLRGGGGEPAAHAEGARSPAVEPLGEFLALRDYEPGDDPRRVHWRSSARRGELLVRQDEAASPGRVILLLDTRPDSHDEASFELAVEVIASLAVRLRRDRVPVEVFSTAGEVLARQRPGAVDLLLDRLAVVEPTAADHLALVCGELRGRLGIGAVIAATGAPDRALVDAMMLLRTRSLVSIVAAHGGGALWPRGVDLVDCSDHPFPDAWNAAARRRRSRPWKPASSRPPLRSAR